jgi:transcriptional regulator with XRE-family HTH domain
MNNIVDIMLESFGSYIKKLRIDREITLRRFCLELNIDVSNWSKVERDRISPKLIGNKLDEIFIFLNCSKEEEKILKYKFLKAQLIKYIPLTDAEILSFLPIHICGNPHPTKKQLNHIIKLLKESY